MSGKAADLGLVRCGGGVTVFWMPALDGEDQPYEPEIFTPQAIELLKMDDPRVWATQYLLRGPEQLASEFDEREIRDAFFHWTDPERTIIRYDGLTFDPDELDPQGFALLRQVRAKIHLSQLRYYLHFDPKHRPESARRTPGQNRPTEWAIAVVGVAPDLHVFLVDYWADDNVNLTRAIDQLYLKYITWAPFKITYEATGAQFWIKGIVEDMEKRNPAYRRPRARTRWGTEVELPRMSNRMAEAENLTLGKEEVYRTILGGYIHRKVLHLDATHHEKPLHQLTNTGNMKVAVDLVDALSQGPPVWEAPPERSRLDELLDRRLSFVTTFLTKTPEPGGRGSFAAASAPWRRRRRAGVR